MGNSLMNQKAGEEFPLFKGLLGSPATGGWFSGCTAITGGGDGAYRAQPAILDTAEHARFELVQVFSRGHDRG